MTNNMFGWLSTIIGRIESPRTWVVVSDDGFSKFTKRGFLRPKVQALRWGDVARITALMSDCFAMHVLGLAFQADGKSDVIVDDVDDGWKVFLEAVIKVFPDFDQAKLRQVEGFFPGEGALVCWERK